MKTFGQYLLSLFPEWHFSDVYRSVLDPEGLRIRCLCCQKALGLIAQCKIKREGVAVYWDLAALNSSLLVPLFGRLASSHHMDLFNVNAVADTRCDKATTGCWHCTHLHVVRSPLGYKAWQMVGNCTSTKVTLWLILTTQLRVLIFGSLSGSETWATTKIMNQICIAFCGMCLNLLFTVFLES